MLTGSLATLPQDCLLSAGVLFCAKSAGSYLPIGVTEGAPDFDPASDLGEIMFDNRAPSRLKGLSRTIGFASLFKGTFKELGPIASGNQVAIIEPGESEAAPDGSGTKVITVRSASSLFAAGDYMVDFRWIFERAGGGYAGIYAPLAIVRKWSMKGNDKKEAQISFEIEAVGDPVNDLSTAPYTIELRSAIPVAFGSPADLIATITSVRLAAFWYAADPAKTLSGSEVVTLPDSRGGSFPSLSGSGSPRPSYNSGAGTIRVDGSQNYLATTAQTAFDLSAVKCFFYIGTFEGANAFSPLIVQDASIGSFSAQMRSNGTDMVANSPIGELDSNEVASTTPRLGVLTISNALAGGASQYVSLDLPGGRVRKLQWDNLFGAGTKCVFIGHMGGTSNFAASTMIAAGALSDYPSLSDIQALQRFAAAHGATLTVSRPKGIIGMGDSIMRGAGTTVPATKAFFNITATSLNATYDGSNTARDGLKAQDIAGVISQMGAPAMNPLMSKIWVVVNAGINDLAAGRTAAQVTADLTTIGQTLKAVGSHVKVCFCKILKDGGLSGGQETDRQTINTNLDAFVAAGKADAIYNAPADADPTLIADSSDGLHPNDTANARMATGLEAVLAAAGT